MRLKDLNMRIGRISKKINPGLGACLKCNTTWRFVKGHETKISDHEGTFPLCEKCWAELTPQKRLPYYYLLMRQWLAYDGYTKEHWNKDYERITAAVLSGK